MHNHVIEHWMEQYAHIAPLYLLVASRDKSYLPEQRQAMLNLVAKVWPWEVV